MFKSQTGETRRQNPRYHWVAALAVTSVFFLVGCSGGSSESEGAGRERVASLPGASSKPSTSAVDVNDRRPLIRLDSTEAEKARLWKDYTHCLIKEGGPQYAKYKVMAMKNATHPDPKIAAVFAACVALQPDSPEERERRNDPGAYKEHQLKWYRCAKAAGYALTAPDPDTGEFGLTEVGPLGDFESPRIVACEREAFGE